MSDGLVSIILPSLNARRFLPERIETILEQSYEHWEAIVLDSHSDDGTWEYFEEVSKSDSRFKLHRVAREGFYAALNRGIQLAEGEYLYIATCDDTMDSRFLETAIAALSQFPDAGIAVTDLQFIDSNGGNDDYGDGRVRTSTAGEVMTSPNFRPIPHDCLLHLTGETVYFSLTQILTRLDAVRKAPPFSTDAGSVADFAWSMGLCKIAATIHIPVKLATWRRHGDQLSCKQEPGRQEIIFNYCRSVGLSKDPWLPPDWRRPLSLPSRNFFASQETGRGEVIRIRVEGIFTLIALSCAHPFQALPAWKAAGFGKHYLRLSWISFLLKIWKVEPVKVSGNFYNSLSK